MPESRSPDGPPRSFGALLRSHRERLGLTQDQLAARAGMGARTIRDLEAGRVRRPRGDSIRLLAEALGLGPADAEAFAAAARPAQAPPPARLMLPPDLRLPASTFVGRQREVAEVRALLRRPGARLLTLTGPPGAGKTRLALEVAADLPADYPDGVVAVALASLTDPVEVMPAVQQALGVTADGGEAPLEAVVQRCEGRHLLLLLDNLEHVLPAATDLLALLDRCPDLQMLVTSRAAARVRGEHEVAVPPLRLPDAGQDPDALRSVPSVALFLERAAATRPSFHLTAGNAGAVAAICRRLDGLPLAIELAAPWVRLLTPGEILDQLDRQLELLVGGPRDLPVRQRTMRATLAWSCDLLDAGPRALLRRLSLFRGGAPLDALDGVCQAAGPLAGGVLPHLAVLVDHSLVGRLDVAGGEPRVAMLETMRDYGRELLAAAGEEEATGLAHLDHYVRLAARANQEMRSGAGASWLERLRRDLDNVRTALAWAIEHGRTEAGLRLAGSLSLLWADAGYRREGLKWVTRLLEAGGPVAPDVRATALQTAGYLWWHLDDHDRAIARHRESLAIFQELGDRRGIAEATRGLGMAIGSRGDHAEAIVLLERALALLRELDDRPLLAMALSNLGVYVDRSGDGSRATDLYQEALALNVELDNALGVAMCLTNLGHRARATGDLALAQARLEEAVAISRRLDAPYHLAAALSNLGNVVRSRGDVRAAAARYRESVALFAGIRHHIGVAVVMRWLAWVACAEGDPVRAVRLYGAATALCPQLATFDPEDEVLHREVLSSLRTRLGSPAFARAYEAGKLLSMGEAAAEALA